MEYSVIITQTKIFVYTMGIQTLSKMIHKECVSGYNTIQLNKLNGKRIAVDISIYMYRYKRSRQLIPDMFILCSLFREHNIHPVFVFDGAPPEHKMDIIEKRREKKRNVRDELKRIDKLLESTTISYKERCMYEKERKCIDRSATHISMSDVENVQQLLTLYGMIWVRSNTEADITCAWLNLNGYVWGVMSDDTDMFPLGCSYVIRNVNIINESCIIYDTYKILNELSITMDELRMLCLTSKNDSNTNNIETKLIYEQYQMFKKNSHIYKYENINMNDSIYRIKDDNINNDFDISPKEVITNKDYDKTKLIKFLEEYNFY